MMRLNMRIVVAALVAAATVWCSSQALAVPFSTGFATGTNPDHLIGQGFSPAVRANPDPFTDPMLALDAAVHLDRFRFFKSNYFFESPPDSGTFIQLNATNFQLAIVNQYFLDLSLFTTSSPELVGLSTNTIVTTATYATGAPIDFEFDSLELSYGAIDYAAIFVRNDGAGNLSVVDVPAMIVNYPETPPGSGTYLPNVDYGDPNADFIYSASNTVVGNFLTTFDPIYADASFVAFFDQEATVLAGDYNGDDVVDAADYTVWRNNLGDPTEADINGAGDGLNGVDAADYMVWKLHYGDPGPGAGGGVAVPEPGTMALIAWAGCMLLTGATGRRRT